MSGVSQFSAVTTGFGWAGGAAGASSWTNGVTQTQISAMAAPPPKKSYRGGFLLLLGAPFIGPAPFALLESLNGVRSSYERMAVVAGINGCSSDLVGVGLRLQQEDLAAAL
jgi:hypothetical protein